MVEDTLKIQKVSLTLEMSNLSSKAAGRTEKIDLVVMRAGHAELIIGDLLLKMRMGMCCNGRGLGRLPKNQEKRTLLLCPCSAECVVYSLN